MAKPTTKGKVNATKPVVGKPAPGKPQVVKAQAKPRVQPAPAPEPVEEVQEIAVEDENYATGAGDVAEEANDGSGDEIFDLSTEELDDPRTPKPDAVRVRIINVTEEHSEKKGTPAFFVHLFSDDLNKDYVHRVYVPKPFEADIRVSPKELSPSEPNEQAQYAIAIHNKRNEAVVDQLRIIAKAQGRTLENVEPPATFTDFVALLNTLVGERDGEFVNMIITRRPNRDTGFLEIQKYFAPELAEEKPQIFQNYKKSWEVEADAF